MIFLDLYVHITTALMNQGKKKKKKNQLACPLLKKIVLH